MQPLMLRNAALGLSVDVEFIGQARYVFVRIKILAAVSMLEGRVGV